MAKGKIIIELNIDSEERTFACSVVTSIDGEVVHEQSEKETIIVGKEGTLDLGEIMDAAMSPLEKDKRFDSLNTPPDIPPPPQP